MVMSKAVEQAAQNTTGKKQLAVDSFAQALKQLPTILADNAGLDSSDLVTRLRQAINNGMTSSGLDLLTPGGGIADMRDLGVVEAYKLKKAVVSSASEAAEVCVIRNIILGYLLTLFLASAAGGQHHPCGSSPTRPNVMDMIVMAWMISYLYPLYEGTQKMCYRSSTTYMISIHLAIM
jgi:hypothetical protein